MACQREGNNIQGLCTYKAVLILWLSEGVLLIKADWVWWGLGGCININHEFFFCILVFWYLWPSWPWRNCSPRFSQFLEIVNTHQLVCFSNINPPVQDPHPHLPLLSGSHTKATTPYPDHSRAGVRQWGSRHIPEPAGIIPRRQP